MRTLAIGLVALCVGSGANAQGDFLSKEAKARIVLYMDCVDEQAQRLESAGEGVAETVEAAIHKCRDEKLAANVAVAADIPKNFRNGSTESQIALIGFYNEGMDKEVRHSAAEKVFDIRVKKDR